MLVLLLSGGRSTVVTDVKMLSNGKKYIHSISIYLTTWQFCIHNVGGTVLTCKDKHVKTGNMVFESKQVHGKASDNKFAKYNLRALRLQRKKSSFLA